MSNLFHHRQPDERTTVLLMAENLTLLSEYRAWLSVHCTCLIATSVGQATQILQKEPIQAMLLSEPLPDGDTIAVIRAAHRLNPQAQKVLLTGPVHLDLAIAAFNEGCIFRCLLAPVAEETVVKAIKDALRRYEMERVQREIADHAAEIDLYLNAMPYWLHRLRIIVNQGARSIAMGTGLIVGAGLLILLLGISILLLLYFLKSILGIDFFEHQHLRDFLPGMR